MKDGVACLRYCWLKSSNKNWDAKKTSVDDFGGTNWNFQPFSVVLMQPCESYLLTVRLVFNGFQHCWSWALKRTPKISKDCMSCSKRFLDVGTALIEPLVFQNYQWMFKPFNSNSQSTQLKWNNSTLNVWGVNINSLTQDNRDRTIIKILFNCSVVITFGANKQGGFPLIFGIFSSREFFLNRFQWFQLVG